MLQIILKQIKTNSMLNKVSSIHKNIYELLLAGGLLILSLKNVFFILLFISKIICIFIIKDLDFVIYVFLFLLICWFYVEWLLLNRYIIIISKLKFVIIIFISLIILAYLAIYIEGTYVSDIVADNWGREGIMNVTQTLSYPNFVFVLHNIMLIIVLLIRKKLRKN